MKNITKEQEKEIIELSKSLKQIEIKNKLNIPLIDIRRVLKDNGVATNKGRLNLSKLSFDYNYFDEIDSVEKGYWLGFLVADGTLKNNRVRLVSKDLDHIEKFKRDIQSEHKITTVEIRDKRTDKVYISYHLQITSKSFTDKLTKWIPINKSEKFSLPKIDEEYLPEFLAGMIDGDGSFGVSNDNSKTLRINLISTKECLQEIQTYLLRNLDIEKTTLQQVTANQPNVWKLYIYGGASDVLKLIYRNENKNLYLKRKQEKLENIISYKIANPSKEGSKRRPIMVFDINGELLRAFDSTKECTDELKLSTSTLFARLKDGKFYKGMRFKGLEIIKY